MITAASESSMKFSAERSGLRITLPGEGGGLGVGTEKKKNYSPQSYINGNANIRCLHLKLWKQIFLKSLENAT